MSRVIAVMACGFGLAACSMSMPSFDMFRGSPVTEQLRIESEPPGADARTSQGHSCRTPCEVSVTASGDLSVVVAMNGYQPQTVPVRANPGSVAEDYDGGGGTSARLQPNPVYVELLPATPASKSPKKAAPKKKSSAAAKAPPGQQATAPDPNSPYPAGYPWPDPR
jgi:hypothetical protein